MVTKLANLSRNISSLLKNMSLGLSILNCYSGWMKDQKVEGFTNYSKV